MCPTVLNVVYPIKLSGTSDVHGRTNDNLTPSVPVTISLLDRPKPKYRCDCIKREPRSPTCQPPTAPGGHYGVEKIMLKLFWVSNTSNHLRFPNLACTDGIEEVFSTYNNNLIHMCLMQWCVPF